MKRIILVLCAVLLAVGATWQPAKASLHFEGQAPEVTFTLQYPKEVDSKSDVTFSGTAKANYTLKNVVLTIRYYDSNGIQIEKYFSDDDMSKDDYLEGGVTLSKFPTQPGVFQINVTGECETIPFEYSDEVYVTLFGDGAELFGWEEFSTRDDLMFTTATGRAGAFAGNFVVAEDQHETDIPLNDELDEIGEDITVSGHATYYDGYENEWADFFKAKVIVRNYTLDWGPPINEWETYLDSNGNYSLVLDDPWCYEGNGGDLHAIIRISIRLEDAHTDPNKVTYPGAGDDRSIIFTDEFSWPLEGSDIVRDINILTDYETGNIPFNRINQLVNVWIGLQECEWLTYQLGIYGTIGGVKVCWTDLTSYFLPDALPDWLVDLFVGDVPPGADDKIYINNGVTNGNQARATTKHEYGHAVSWALGSFAYYVPGPHLNWSTFPNVGQAAPPMMNDNNRRSGAYEEGKADFFAGVATRLSPYFPPEYNEFDIDWYERQISELDLADVRPDGVPAGEKVEGNVSTLLWDLYDDRVDIDHDNQAARWKNDRVHATLANMKESFQHASNHDNWGTVQEVIHARYPLRAFLDDLSDDLEASSLASGEVERHYLIRACDLNTIDYYLPEFYDEYQILGLIPTFEPVPETHEDNGVIYYHVDGGSPYQMKLAWYDGTDFSDCPQLQFDDFEYVWEYNVPQYYHPQTGYPVWFEDWFTYPSEEANFEFITPRKNHSVIRAQLYTEAEDGHVTHYIPSFPNYRYLTAGLLHDMPEPTNVTLHEGNGSHVRVEWDAPDDPYIDYYKVYRGLNTTPWAMFGTTEDTQLHDPDYFMFENGMPPYAVDWFWGHYDVVAVDKHNPQRSSDHSEEAIARVTDMEITPEPIFDKNGLVEIPTDTELLGNYPNPFNAVTNLKIALSEPQDVKVMIFNTLGRLVQEGTFEGMNPGVHNISINMNSYQSGMYFARVLLGNESFTTKLILVK